MKNLLTLILFLIKFLPNQVFAQSGTIAPNYIIVPGVAALPACVVADKGKTVYNTTDNKMYFCNGTAWQSMSGTSGASTWTASGNDITNTNTGNVGVGVATPLAKLHVNSAINTNALFGLGSTGISLQQNYPTIGFNQYRDLSNTSKYIGNGYAAVNFFDPLNGNFNWSNYPSGVSSAITPTETAIMTLSTTGDLKVNSLAKLNGSLPLSVNGNAIGGFNNSGVLSVSNNAGGFSYNNLLIDGSRLQANNYDGTFTTIASKLSLNPFGGITSIGNFGAVIPSANIDVARGNASGGTAAFRGTTHVTHINFSTREDTYIRGGKWGSTVLINDGGIGDVEIAKDGGKVTVGSELYGNSIPNLNIIPLGIFSYNLSLNVLNGTSGSITNLAGSVAAGTYTRNNGIALDDAAYFDIPFNSGVTAGYTTIVAIGTNNFKNGSQLTGNYVSRSELVNDNTSVKLNYFIDSFGTHDLEVSGKVIVYGIK